MGLAAGVRLGAYEITAPIGAGGMGEVYRARDPRLNRDVAIKVLPASVSGDADRVRRFEQEARAAAALNHPNILAVHDIGQYGSTGEGSRYIVSELLEGETLRERLNDAPLPVRTAVEYAIQIAHGLAAAHERGIVHRDLKPENIFVTTDGRVKILDFGLAKLTQADPVAGAKAGHYAHAGVRPEPSLSVAPTTPPDTLPGVVLGTVGYISPEQVRGLTADHRADIFSFGAILYEMLSGQRPFRGATTIEAMTAILKDDPPELPTAERHIPPALVRIVDHCLEKNPAARFKTADDLAFALEALTSYSDSAAAALVPLPVRKTRERLAWTIAAATAIALVATLVAGTVLYIRRTPGDTRVYRASILPPPSVSIPALLTPNARFALSPDGRRLAFIGAESTGVTRLWVQSLDGAAAQPFEGTEGASVPFWSPDGRFIGFFAGGKVKRIDAIGGPPLTLADTGGTAGAAWSGDGVILFATFGVAGSNPLRRVSAAGSLSSQATTLNGDNGETRHWFPFFLPDGRHFLYLALGSTASGPNTPNGIYVGTVGSDERKLLMPGGSSAMYAQGYLVFLREQTLMAQPFDLQRLELASDAVPIAEHVTIGGASGVAGGFSVSATGVLAYQTGPAGVGGQATVSQPVWFDRSGRQVAVLGDEARFGDLELTPDGGRAALSTFDPARRTRDIWLFDTARGLRTRLTFDPTDELTPVWSPDGTRIVFGANRSGHFDLYLKASSGAGAEEQLLADKLDKYPLDWSSDGRFILLSVAAPKTSNDLWALPVSSDRKAFPLLQTQFSETSGRFAPDGRWIAYVSNESGRNEVYVAPFPGPGGKWQISAAGGDWPRWRRDGREIFYVAPDNKLMSAVVSGAGSAFDVGPVRPLFGMRAITNQRYMYDISPDGQRFLVNTIAQEATAEPITLVVNWPALLKK